MLWCENGRNWATTTPTSHTTPFQIPSDSFTCHYANQTLMNVLKWNFAPIMLLMHTTLWPKMIEIKPKLFNPYVPNMWTLIHIVDFLPKILVNMWYTKLKFWRDPFLITICLYVKNGFSRVNSSLSPHIPHIKIFDFPGDFIQHISANMWVISMKFRVYISTITLYFCA